MIELCYNTGRIKIEIPLLVTEKSFYSKKAHENKKGGKLNEKFF